jgi:hypothetical protein
MVDADTFATKKIYNILINLLGRSQEGATINGADGKAGLAATWESSAAEPYDVDVAEDNDDSFAGIMMPDGYYDLDTLFVDNQDISIMPPFTLAWGLYVASGGALIKGDPLYVDGVSDGYFTGTKPTQGAGVVLFPRGAFHGRVGTDGRVGDQYHTDVAAITIQGIYILPGGQQTIALV